MRVLLTNDDGIDAPGLAVLEQLVAPFATEIWVVAPKHEQSGMGHALTLHAPLRVHKHDERRFSVEGTPTDCVLIAVNDLMKDCRPDMVFSGINAGANLGEDMTYSGTVSAAMEGCLGGIKSVALSLMTYSGTPPHWPMVLEKGPEVLRTVLKYDLPEKTLLNINFPPISADKVTGVEVVSQGCRKIGSHFERRTDLRGRDYYWIGVTRSEDGLKPGTDLEAIFRGAITVTPLNMDMTDKSQLSALEASFGTQ